MPLRNIQKVCDGNLSAVVLCLSDAKNGVLGVHQSHFAPGHHTINCQYRDFYGRINSFVGAEGSAFRE